MALITNNNLANEIIKNSKKYYEVTSKENFDNIQIFISANFDEDSKLFIDTADRPSANNLSGMYIEANPVSTIPTILINANLFNQPGCPFLGTILHELTHASDFAQFVTEYCNGDWFCLKKNPNYEALHLWSEYHARVFQIIHMRILATILFPDNYNYDTKTIGENLKNNHLSDYNKDLNDAIAEDNITLVEIVKYCARFYVCQLYNPELSLYDNLPQAIYNYFPDIIRFYDDLKPLQTYKDASSKFSMLTSLLKNFL